MLPDDDYNSLQSATVRADSNGSDHARTDLTLAHARADRDALADRTDVLDKVGVLRTLPDDFHATTEMVAEFYEVPKETIFTLVRNNRDEIESDGYRVVTRSAFEETFGTKAPSSASRIALFPRRAILRVGMLLRDSQVARRVRDALLDAERGIKINPTADLESIRYAHAQWGLAIEVAEAQRQRADVAEARVAELQPRVEEGDRFKRAIEGGAGLSVREFHKKYFSSVTETEMWNHLYAKKYVINQLGKGSLRRSGPRAGTYRDGSQHRHPTFKGKPYFYRHADTNKAGQRYENTYVRPGKWELELRDRLAAEGLPANENTAGLFGIEELDGAE